MKKSKVIIITILLILALFASLFILNHLFYKDPVYSETQAPVISFENLDKIKYTNSPYVEINNNKPLFKDYTNKPFENYSELDSLERCGAAFANLHRNMMPSEDREPISSVKPTGWINKKYEFIDGSYIYNRCHLIGFQLAGENANEKNLITGTRFLNVEGMLPFENMVADYIKESDNHVLYRVTPIFVNDELVCRGVTLEAYSVEDNGEGICFCVYCFNVQPGVTIDYRTGDNWDSGIVATEKIPTQKYIVNERTKKFHLPECSSIKKISEDNKMVLIKSRTALISEGYDPCGYCNP